MRTHAAAAGVLAIAAAFAFGACGPAGGQAGDLSAVLTVTPMTPLVNQSATVEVTLRGRDGHAIDGATLEIEGHMAHPGMAPVIDTAVGRPGGVYAAPLSFSMAGDWVLFVSGHLADGRRIREQVGHLSVRAAG
jgi:hypothetical protein